MSSLNSLKFVKLHFYQGRKHISTLKESQKMTIEKREDLIKSTFNSLSLNNLNILNDFYSENIEFTDPIEKINGLVYLKKYYAKIYKNVSAIHFNFHQINNQEDLFFVQWTMTLQATGLNSGVPFDVDGLSVLKFNAQDKVEYHRDYLDLGSMVYENIPVLGRAIKFIKKQLS